MKKIPTGLLVTDCDLNNNTQALKFRFPLLLDQQYQ